MFTPRRDAPAGSEEGQTSGQRSPAPRSSTEHGGSVLCAGKCAQLLWATVSRVMVCASVPASRNAPGTGGGTACAWRSVVAAARTGAAARSQASGLSRAEGGGEEERDALFRKGKAEHAARQAWRSVCPEKEERAHFLPGRTGWRRSVERALLASQAAGSSPGRKIMYADSRNRSEILRNSSRLFQLIAFVLP